MDYFLSSNLYHQFRPSVHPDDGPSHDISYAQSFFTEQLIQFDSLGYSFAQPTFSTAFMNVLRGKKEGEMTVGRVQQDWLIQRPRAYYEHMIQYLTTSTPAEKHTAGRKKLIDIVRQTRLSLEGMKVLVCPQYLPKLHPEYDDILLPLLVTSPSTRLILLEPTKKLQWKATLLARWKDYLTEMDLTNQVFFPHEAIASNMQSIYPNQKQLTKAQVEAILKDQVVWMPSLSPEEYLFTLSVGDVMLDPYPFGGGVTTLEAFSVLTPVITLPAFQNVPQLAAGMIAYMQLPAWLEELLVVPSPVAYLHHVQHMLLNEEELVRIRQVLSQQVHRIYDDHAQESVHEWERFLKNVVRTQTAEEK
jgi:hypothetical protein